MSQLLSERKGLFGANLSLRLLKDVLPFLSPILLGMSVDVLSGSSGRDRSLFGIGLPQGQLSSVLVIAGAMAALAVAKSAVGYVHTIVSAHMGRHVVEAARRKLAIASMHMSLASMRKIGSGDLLDRCLADTKSLRSFTQDVVIRIVSNSARLLFPVVYMFTIDAVLALVVLAVLPLQSGVSWVLQGRLKQQAHEARSREASHTSVVKEAIDGWQSVVSLGGQRWAAGEMFESAAASEEAKLAKKRTSAAISVIISLCTNIGIAAVYAIGGWRIVSSGVLDGSSVDGALTLGALTAFVGVAKKTYAPFQAYTNIVSSYRTGMVNLERIAAVLAMPTIDLREEGPDLVAGIGEVELEGVTFSYDPDQRPTLNAVNARLPGKALTVITGASGEGKSTLLRLLLGIDVPHAGVVRIDGQAIDAVRLRSLQDAVAFVPQEPMLFTGTVRENLLLGLAARPDADLRTACSAAGLLDVIEGMPKGFETVLGSGHQQLSGGQLRRLAIARALLRKPAILLLDEPTAGLDRETSVRLLHSLWLLTGQATIVMVSHDREPVGISDHHLALIDGRLCIEPDIEYEDHSSDPEFATAAEVINLRSS